MAMIGRAMGWILAIALTGGVATPLFAQQLADEQSRREAVRFFRAGQDFMAAERFDRAAEEFTKATQKDGLFTLAYYQLGHAQMNLRRYAGAITAFEDCIESARRLHALAAENRFQVDKQRDDEIREMRETVRMLQQGSSRRAEADQRQIQAAHAEQHLHDLERQRSSIGGPFQPPAEVLLSLGSAYFRNGDRPAAERQWKAAIDVNPRLGEAHNNLAVIYMQTGRYPLAEAEITAAEGAGFRVNPQFKADLKNVAR
jgi:tetratricopeptide (TPR) repeat protein